MIALLTLLGVLANVGILIFLESYVLVQLWSWFVVPLGVMAIGQLWVIGLLMIKTVVFHKGYKEPVDVKKMDADKKWEIMLNPYIVILLAWGVGYIVKVNM